MTGLVYKELPIGDITHLERTEFVVGSTPLLVAKSTFLKNCSLENESSLEELNLPKGFKIVIVQKIFRRLNGVSTFVIVYSFNCSVFNYSMFDYFADV